MNTFRNPGPRPTTRAGHGLGGPAGLAILVGVVLLALGSASAQEGLNVEEVFWCEEPETEEEMTIEACEEARELVMFECTACHHVGPVVTAQKTPEEWDATFDTHADRISHLEDEEIELIRRFVVTHYNPDQPVPELPEALQEQGNNQAF